MFCLPCTRIVPSISGHHQFGVGGEATRVLIGRGTDKFNFLIVHLISVWEKLACLLWSVNSTILDSTTLRFKELGFNNLGSNNPHINRSLDSRKQMLCHSPFTILAFNNHWIQQTWIQQPWIQRPLDSIVSNSTILWFNKLGFNNPWTRQRFYSTIGLN